GNHVLPPKPDSTLKRHCPDSPLTSGQLCFQHDISTLARQTKMDSIKMSCQSGKRPGLAGYFGPFFITTF
ncbi:hypothetical protein, partial [Klebsiella michiganensis]